MAAPTDSLLLADWARGREEAFEELFLRHYSRVFGVVFRLLGDKEAAEDVAQEVFLKLHGGRLRIDGQESLGGWLYRVAVNLALNQARGKDRRERRERQAAGEGALSGDGDGDPARAVLREEERATVRRALAEIPERSRHCLLLRGAGLSYAEIAEAIGVAPGSVGTLLARAEARFRDAYRAMRIEEG